MRKRTANPKQYPVPEGHGWTVKLGRVHDDVPVIGGEMLILICCADCGHQLTRLSPGDALIPDGTMFFDCTHCDPADAEPGGTDPGQRDLPARDAA